MKRQPDDQHVIDDSGTFEVRKLRKSTNWPALLTSVTLGTGLVATWATNANRLTTAEQAITEGKTERVQMEQHLNSSDQEITSLREQLRFIIEQLQIVNQKLDRMEEERRK